MSILFSGTATAMITPFGGDGKINFSSMEKMIEYQIENGTDALVILGTTGEPATMTEEEKEQLMRFSVEKVAGRAKVIFGTGSNNTAHAVEASKKAEALGADGILAVTPYYNKCTQNGLYEYYRAISESVNIPVLCYNVPSRTGVNILPETMERIACLENIAGIKEACGNMAQACETMRLIRGKCPMYSGEDSLNLPILAIGGEGLISVLSNILPHEVKELYTLVKSRDLTAANKLSDALLPVTDALFCEVNPIPVKAAANLIGLDAGEPRAPLTPIEPAHLERLTAALEKFGVKLKK